MLPCFMALLVDSRCKSPIWKMFIRRGLTIWVELLSFISIRTSNFIEFLAPHFVGFTGIDDPYEPPLNCEVCINITSAAAKLSKYC